MRGSPTCSASGMNERIEGGIGRGELTEIGEIDVGREQIDRGRAGPPDVEQMGERSAGRIIAGRRPGRTSAALTYIGSAILRLARRRDRIDVAGIGPGGEDFLARLAPAEQLGPAPLRGARRSPPRARAAAARGWRGARRASRSARAAPAPQRPRRRPAHARARRGSSRPHSRPAPSARCAARRPSAADAPSGRRRRGHRRRRRRDRRARASPSRRRRGPRTRGKRAVSRFTQAGT